MSARRPLRGRPGMGIPGACEGRVARGGPGLAGIPGGPVGPVGLAGAAQLRPPAATWGHARRGGNPNMLYAGAPQAACAGVA